MLIVGLLVCWFVGLLVCWFVGLLVCWFVGLLVCWFVGLLVCWFVGLFTAKKRVESIIDFTTDFKSIVKSRHDFTV